MKERLGYLDAACGLLIVWMIIGHCNQFTGYAVQMTWLKYLRFKMPWFFYKSGLFFKPKMSDGMRRSGGKLLRPFVTFGIIGCIFEMICSIGVRGEGIRHFMNRVVYDTVYEQSIPGNRPLWFLLTLYLVIVIANYLLPRIHPLLVAGGSFLCAYIVHKLHLDFSPWILGNLPASLCFYALGYWMRDKETKWWIMLLALIISIGIILAPVPFPTMVLHSHKMAEGSYVLFYLVALASIIICNNFFRLLTPILKFPVLTHIGRNSMNYFLTHWILLVIVTTICRDVCHLQNGVALFWILIGSCVAVLPWVNRFIQYIDSKGFPWLFSK